jgi:hypothetical protein
MRFDGLPEPFRRHEGLHPVRLGKDDDKFFPTVAGEVVNGPRVLAEQLGQQHQRFISAGWPYWSLNSLKWSMSSISRDNARRSAGPAPSLFEGYG